MFTLLNLYSTHVIIRFRIMDKRQNNRQNVFIFLRPSLRCVKNQDYAVNNYFYDRNVDYTYRPKINSRYILRLIPLDADRARSFLSSDWRDSTVLKRKTMSSQRCVDIETVKRETFYRKRKTYAKTQRTLDHVRVYCVVSGNIITLPGPP